MFLALKPALRAFFQVNEELFRLRTEFRQLREAAPEMVFHLQETWSKFERAANEVVRVSGSQAFKQYRPPPQRTTTQRD